MKYHALFTGLCALACPLHLLGLTIEVILATDQTPGDAQTQRVGTIHGGVWDQAGRVLLSGRYQPSLPGGMDRNAVWVWSGPLTSRELYSDGDSVPYFSTPVVGPVIAISSPILQPWFGGYRTPANYWAFQSSVASRLPEIPESRALWVDAASGAPGAYSTLFVVNDLETQQDGAVRFTRPSLSHAILRERSNGAGLDPNTTFVEPGGRALQVYVNGSYSDVGSGRGGSVVWRVRFPFSPVVSDRSGVVKVLAASSGMGLAAVPGANWSFIQLMGVAPDETLIWHTSNNGENFIQRGELGSWSALFEPGMPAPAARGGIPSPLTPLTRIGATSLLPNGGGVLAEVTYASSAGVMAGRSALLLHDHTQAKLLAYAQEDVMGTLAGTRLEPILLGAFDAPSPSTVAFFNSVRGGTQPFPTQALLLASETNTWMLARQYDALPVPADVDRIFQFRFPVLSAKPDGTVAFAAEIELISGERKEILYKVTPGTPNRYDVLLTAGDSITVQTPDGPRVATIRRFNTAYWKPGAFDKLLVSVDLAVTDTSAVLLLGESPAIEPRIDAVLQGETVRLRWPSGTPGALESTPSLQQPEWKSVPVEPTVAEGFQEVSVSILGTGTTFFRLR